MWWASELFGVVYFRTYPVNRRLASVVTTRLIYIYQLYSRKQSIQVSSFPRMLFPRNNPYLNDLSCDAIHPQHSSIPPQMSPKYSTRRYKKNLRPTNAHALLELSQLGSIHLGCE